MTAAAFIDRDGVLNALVADPDSGVPESPLSVNDVVLLPGAAQGARKLRDQGYRLVGVSNQPAAAKGKLSVEAVWEIQARVVELLAAEEVSFDAFYLCLHHPDGVVAALAGPCDCRKPAPGMLLCAARELTLDLPSSWMIGDTDSDIEAGIAAGCRTALIEESGSAHKRAGSPAPDLSAPHLLALSGQLLGAGWR